MKKIIDISGNRYGKLIVLNFIERKNRHSIFKCKCDCGKIVEASSNILKAGKKASCGCYRLECIKKRSATHGLSGHPLFATWSNMKNRCYYQKHNRYANYGGKGIQVCKEWLQDFKVFYDWSLENGWEKGLSIDRIDNNKNYEPSNCKWSTIKEQNSNRTTCRYITFNGKTKLITEWASFLNISHAALNKRFKKGLPLEKILISK